MAVTTLQWTSARCLTPWASCSTCSRRSSSRTSSSRFPTGRLEGRAGAALIARGYVTAVGGSVLVAPLGGFDPRNLLDRRPRRRRSPRPCRTSSCCPRRPVSLAGVAVLRRTAPAGHAPPAPAGLLVDSFALGLVMFAALLVAGAFGLPGFEHLRLVTFAVLGWRRSRSWPACWTPGWRARAVADLLVELRRTRRRRPARAAGPGAARPVAELAYWLPAVRDLGRPGRPATAPAAGPDRGVRHGDRPGGRAVAALSFDRSLEDERELLDAVSAAAAIALENGRLQAELRARLQELHGSRARVLEAGQRERARLERDLHDGAQQRLVALSLELGLLGRRLGGRRRARRRA